ncbi:putative FAD dependent monooxygenase domain protein [Burkholderia pseudomallei ABCPW 107]|nr:putative FAD dependent monooxygenase domain protein [Burkholderia pseudomallei ABCPW 107]
MIISDQSTYIYIIEYSPKYARDSFNCHEKNRHSRRGDCGFDVGPDAAFERFGGTGVRGGAAHRAAGRGSQYPALRGAGSSRTRPARNARAPVDHDKRNGVFHAIWSAHLFTPAREIWRP